MSTKKPYGSMTPEEKTAEWRAMLVIVVVLLTLIGGCAVLTNLSFEDEPAYYPRPGSTCSASELGNVSNSSAGMRVYCRDDGTGSLRWMVG